jgi:UDP-3-O-[3-hydroxymyristoyl] glucosamine N-acyltransferase
MQFPNSLSLKTLAEILGIPFVGNPDLLLSGLNEIHRVKPGEIVFVDHPKYFKKALESAASCVIINEQVECPPEKGLLISKDPFSSFNKLILHFNPVSPFVTGQISPSAKIGKDTTIYPGVYVGNGVEIGEGCILYPNVVLYPGTRIGNGVIIHAGSVIGADAFYYKKREDHFEKLITCGRTIIEDNVEIGALCTIDRGVTADTIIGAGSKLDNQVHIGHDTVTGKMCLIAAQAGVAGVVNVGNRVTLWGQAGITSDVTLGDGSTVYAQSGVSGNTDPGKQYFGSPAGEAREKMKEIMSVKRIPDILEKLNKISK